MFRSLRRRHREYGRLMNVPVARGVKSSAQCRSSRPSSAARQDPCGSQSLWVELWLAPERPFASNSSFSGSRLPHLDFCHGLCNFPGALMKVYMAKNVGHASMGATNPRRIPSFAKIASRRRAMKSKKPGNGLCTRMRASTSVRKKPAGKKSRALAAPFVRPTWLHIISEFVIMKSHH